MAATARNLSYPVFLVLLLCISFTEATEFVVGGGPNAWSGSTPESLINWASKYRFQIQDSLRWNLTGNGDSVAQVTKEDYEKCSASNPIAVINQTNPIVKLTKSGPHYFVSSSSESCKKGQKLIVVVMSPRSGKHPAAASPATAPSPSSSSSIAASPSMGASGSPAAGPMAGGAGAMRASSCGLVGVLGVVLGAWSFVF